MHRLTLALLAVSFSSLSMAHMDLRRSTSVPLVACSSADFSANLPLTKRLLQSLLTELTTANPEVFTGDLAPDKLCAGPHLSESQRAWARSDSRSFNVETGLILRSKNIEQIAVVMGHELAHISLRHSPLDGNPLPGQDGQEVSSLLRRKEMILNRIYQLPKPAPAGVFDELQGQATRFEDEIEALFVKNFDHDYYMNWMETEADVVGSMYYLRAGFSSSEIAFRVEDIAADAQAAGLDARNNPHGGGFDPHQPSVSQTAAERSQRAFEACGLANPEGIPRGGNRYPLPCWQIWNLKHNLPAIDSTFRELFTRPATARTISRPSLEEVKAEIRQALSSKPEVKPTRIEPSNSTPPKPKPKP